MPRRLRAFFRNRTLQAAAGEFTWVRNAAQLTKGGAPIFNYVPPDWNDPLPTFTFTQGIASTQTFSGYFTDGNGGTSTITGSNLPSGVTVNSALRRLEYNGSGAVATANNVTLTADDGYNALTNITTLVINDTAGTAGMVFAEGDVPSGWYVGSNLSGFQAEVKNRWPDGSAKIAVVSWSGATAQTINIGKTATAPTGSALSLTALRAMGLTGSVSLGTYGTVQLATVIAGLPFRQWLSGTQCSEWHWREPVGVDQTLAAWIYVRLYANNRIWIRVSVENTSVGILSSVTQTGKRYRAQIALNGSSVYDSQSDATLSFPQNAAYSPYGQMWYWPLVVGEIPHWSRSRWSKQFWYDGGALRPVGHDGEYLRSSKLFLHYGWQYNGSNSYTVTDTPLGRGNLPADWGQGGFSPQIGYVPEWDAQYVASPQGSTQQQSTYYSVLANASAGGMYFVRDETTRLLPLWTDYQNLGGSGPQSFGAASDAIPYRIDFSHQPSAGFVAYLITGDYFFIEQIQNYANWGWFGRNYSDRNGVDSLFYEYGGQVRAFAWSFRTLGQALCVTPDATTLTGDATNDYHYRIAACYRNALDKNIEKQLWAHVDGGANGAYGESPWVNPFGVVATNPAWFQYGTSIFGVGAYGEGAFQQNFCCVSLNAVYDMNLLPDQTEFLRLLNHALKFPVGLLGLGDANGWPYNFAGVYALPFSDGSTLKTNWTQVYDLLLTKYPAFPDLRPVASSGAAMFDSSPHDGTWGGIWDGYAGNAADWAYSNWWELHPAISAAVDKGVSGASTAYARLKSLQSPTSGTWTTYSSQWNTVHPAFAVRPRSEAVT